MNISAINKTATTPKFTGLTDGIGKMYNKIGNSATFDNIMKKDFAKSDKLMTHLSTASSAVTSGLYVYKNLTDKRKTKNERITSAINNAMTFAIGTALSYTVTGLLGKAKGAVASKYFENKGGDVLKAAREWAKANPNATELPKDKGWTESLKSVKNASDGIGIAIDLVTCSAINRFFVPVFITPIANKLGDKLCKFLDKRDAEKAAKAQEQNLNKQA